MLYQLSTILQAIITPLWSFFGTVFLFGEPILVILFALVYIRNFLRISMTSRIGFAVLLFCGGYLAIGLWSIFYIPPKF